MLKMGDKGEGARLFFKKAKGERRWAPQKAMPSTDCKSQITSYIGMCTTSLSRRLTMHLANGSIKNHTRDTHNQTLSRTMLVQNTTVLDSVQEKKKMQYMEALYINMYKPIINVQGGTGVITLPSLR